ncbi:MAG: putative porin [Bacteroidota bacterium]|nr:putative porin [Bacteroidota bacterium]
MYHRIIYIIICFFTIVYLANSQIVNDSAKQVYGTNTTKIFTQNTIYRNELKYFKKDTLFARQLPLLKSSLPLDFGIKLDTATKKVEKEKINVSDSITTDSTNRKKNKNIIKPIINLLLPDSLTPQQKYRRRFYKNEYRYIKPDTSMSDIHNYNYIFIKRNIYQNQGVIGTPSKAVFYNQPTELGYQSGFNAYDVYYTRPEDLKYYNTRSPYTRVYYLANTGDENNITFDINRNIYRNWNMGVYYQRINSNKIYGQTDRANNFLAQNQDFKIYTSFKSNNERYHLLANFNYFVSKTNEQGGLIMAGSKKRGSRAANDSATQNRLPSNMNAANAWLVAAGSKLEPYRNDGSIYSRDRRVAYHLYHQYDIIRHGKLSVFHEFQRKNQKFTYEDPAIKTNANYDSLGNAFYRNAYKSKDSTYYNNQFLMISNKVGLKTATEFLDIIVFGRQRKVFAGDNLYVIQAKELTDAKAYDAFFSFDPNSKLRLTETYAGGEIIFKPSNSLKVHLKGEGMIAFQNSSISDTYKNNFKGLGDHNFGIDIQYKNLLFGYNQILTSPNIIMNYMDHNNFRWNKEFAPTVSNTFYGVYKTLIAKKFDFEISPRITSIINHVYYETDLLVPKQVNDKNGIYISSVDFLFHPYIGPFHAEIFGKYTLGRFLIGDIYYNTAADVIRFPTLYANSKLYALYSPKKKKGRIQFMFGLDFHYRSSYNGDAYMPATGQFYVQNNFTLKDYVLVDFYINARVKNALVFTRVNQLNSIIGQQANSPIGSNGYYVSPGYPSSRLFLSIGFQWLLFD